MPPSSQQTQPSVIAVVGPTATGKTALGVHIARHLNAEVISADSQLVYQGLSIGTAKPTEAEKGGIVHHMIDQVPPTEAYSVARYQKAASAILNTRLAKNQPTVVVGGTGFYLRALLQERFIPSVPPDEHFRQHLHAMAEEQGRTHLHQLLTKKDPRRAAQLHPNDLFRVIRALEIIEHTGEVVPDPARLPEAGQEHLKVTWIGLGVEDRDWLRARIDHRIEAMMGAGWLEETTRLMQAFGPEAHALQVAHGYPELVEHLLAQRTLDEALEQIRINIHQYATRQFTWFHRNPDVHWLAADTTSFPDLCRAALQRVDCNKV